MPDNIPFIATPSQTHLIWAAAIMVALLGGAILIEVLRRRRERRLRLDAEWRTVQKIAKEKDLGKKERALLDAFLTQSSADAPLRAITLRQSFDQCVEREIQALAALKDGPRLDEHGAVLRDIRIKLGLDYIPFGQRIHSTRELYRAQPLWAATSGETAPNWERMSVVAVDEAHFYLVPHNPKDHPPFRPGQELRCRMWREEDARYVYNATVERVEDDPATWVMAHTNDLQRMQSRAHFRIRYEAPANVGILNAPRDGDLSDVDKREVVTRLRGQFTSLSGGGFAVVVPQPVPKQILLRTTIDLGAGGEPLEVTGRLVGAVSLSSGRYLVRAAFAAMSDATREQISHYVFQQQQPVKSAEAVNTEEPE